FVQAEDGIRYRNVTGVQTCALPIFEYFSDIKYDSHAVLNINFDNRTWLFNACQLEESIKHVFLGNDTDDFCPAHYWNCSNRIMIKIFSDFFDEIKRMAGGNLLAHDLIQFEIER